jgi:cobyrinic acid a,c-diamide synthase
MTSHPSARIFLVSAIASGQGKTTVTAALARKLKSEGQRVRVFKAGPDFLDPMMLERASGAPVHNLDMWMVGAEECRRLLAEAAREADVVLVEGVMGLYDGTPSSADLAKAFGIPVIVVLDARAMAQTAGAVVHGLRDYGPVEVAGVIANNVASPGHAQMIADSMRGTALLGTLAKQGDSLPERHLGLTQPQEVQDLERLLDNFAAQLVLNREAWDALPSPAIQAGTASATNATPLQGLTIAIARDVAFSFLYQANLDCLRRLGASLVFFSPLADEAVPPEADAVYLTGGYPELHGRTLSQASAWKESIRKLHAKQVPIVAECGAMMAMTETLVDADGHAWPMAGLLEGTVHMQTRLAALGPQALETPHGTLRGHAFHYSRFETPLAPEAHTVKHPSGQAGEAVYRVGSLTASYFHSYFPSCPAAAAQLFLPRKDN